MTVVLSPPPYRIYLLRHAKAAAAAGDQRDFDRGLDDVGYAEAESIADQAADKGFRPDRVISSTAVRCHETADAIRRAHNETVDFQFVDELYNGTANTYLEIIDAQNDSQSVMLVGHNPTMDQVLEALVGHDAAAAAIPQGYPTAGLAVLDHGGNADAPWTLTAFLKP